MDITFEGFPKVPRYSRECIVTEKIDGTNAQIMIDHDGRFYPGSRTRWLSLDNDNHGFARWAFDHREELTRGLGPGRHFGEWWGQGIQRGYGLKEKRFSLFNVIRWDVEMFREFKLHPWELRRDKDRGQEPVFKQPPQCCRVVPVILTCKFGDLEVNRILGSLSTYGSFASLGFMNPEGIVIYHTAGGYLFKKTLEKDDEHKGLST